jgi:hypothetical protein
VSTGSDIQTFGGADARVDGAEADRGLHEASPLGPSQVGEDDQSKYSGRRVDPWTTSSGNSMAIRVITAKWTRRPAVDAATPCAG